MCALVLFTVHAITLLQNLSLCLWIILSFHVLLSQQVHTGCLLDFLTLSVHPLYAHCEDRCACFVAISVLLCVCVQRPVCSLCTKAWKHVPVLVMLHSQEHPRCELSIQVWGPLWPMQIRWKYCVGSLHANHRTACCMLHATRILPHNITSQNKHI